MAAPDFLFCSMMSIPTVVDIHNVMVRQAARIRRELRALASLETLCNQSHRATVRRMTAEGRWLGGPNEFGTTVDGCSD